MLYHRQMMLQYSKLSFGTVGTYGTVTCYDGFLARRARARGASRWSGGPGVGARCGNGLFPTYKSPKFYLSFTILVSFILVKYPDRIG